MPKLKINARYGIVPNELLNNPNISLKAQGLFVYLQSKPDGWRFSISRIVTQNKDGKDGIRSAIRELEASGYLKRTPQKNKQGQWNGYDYILSENPNPTTENPTTENPTTENPTTENPDTLSKKDSSKKDRVKKIEKKTKKFIKKLKEELKDLKLNKEEVDELKRFVDYWTEPNKTKTKLRWELQPTWDMRRRAQTWMKNIKKWNLNKKKGMWKCEYGYWHQEGEKCGHGELLRYK